ncbi:MAG: RodZ domain-containing protein [Candidatus Sulfotelmatobacter sp.]
MGKFGDKFRKERERQGIKLEDVSNSTKISSRMLRAIEDEHFDQLPGGVFNKGFIRAYAKHLGLDDDEAISGYVTALNQFNSQQLGPETLTAQHSAIERRTGQRADRRHAGDRPHESRRSASGSRADDSQDGELPGLQLPKAEHVRPRRRMAVHSDLDVSRWRLPALVVLLIVAGAFWWSHSRNARANGANPAAANVSPSAMTPASNPLTLASAGSNEPTRTAASVPSSPALAPNHPAKSAAHTGRSSSSPASSTSSRSAATIAANTAGAKEDAAQDESGADQPAVSATPQASKPVANLTLVIRASENSWISVTADGQPVLHETLIAPAHTSIRAAREIVVRAGNAAGVTFALNGQEFPSQGAEGEVKTLIFDGSGLRPAAPPAALPATTPAAPAPTTPPADPAR